MKISLELATQISDSTEQLGKLGIKLGSVSRGGPNISKKTDFVLINEDNEVYIVEHCESEIERMFGQVVDTSYNLEEQTERIDDFLIDFHLWYKNGTIQPKKIIETKNYIFHDYHGDHIVVEDKLLRMRQSVPKNNLPEDMKRELYGYQDPVQF